MGIRNDFGSDAVIALIKSHNPSWGFVTKQAEIHCGANESS